MFFGYSRSCFLENAWKQLQVELVDKAGNYLQQLRPQMGGLGAQVTPGVQIIYGSSLSFSGSGLQFEGVKVLLKCKSK